MILSGLARGTLVFLCGALHLVWSAAALARTPQTCPSAGTAQIDITNTVAAVFVAIKADDRAEFKARIAADFYVYDGGKRFDGSSLWDLVQTQQASGKKYEWSVTEPEVHLLCDWAWVTYVNKGSVTDVSGRQDLTWLESAILHYQQGRWRVQFLHSTRAAPH